MNLRTTVLAVMMKLVGIGALAGLSGCQASRNLATALDTAISQPGTFHHSQQLTRDLFGLEESAFERFKIYFQGPADDPDIVVMDPLGDDYRFDGRSWELAEGGAAVEVVSNALARTESAQAMIGHDAGGRIVTLGIAVKERRQTSYKAGQSFYTVSYNRFGRFRVGQAKFHQKPATVDAEGSSEDG